MDLPLFTLDDYEHVYADRHLLHGVVMKWAKERPGVPALISADGSRSVTWSEFDCVTSALACELLQLGFEKGDFLVTLLPLSVDHILLEYACFKIGVIVAPLDLRLSPAEVIRTLEILRPRGFVCLGANDRFDFREVWHTVQAQCPWIEHVFAADSTDKIAGARPLSELTDQLSQRIAGAISVTDPQPDALAEAASSLSEDDGALVIFTTGSTGSPKPALLSHRNITVQNMCQCGSLFDRDRGMRTLIHLPPSHVGCQTELLMSTLFGGGTAVLLEVFDASRSLRAIAQHRINFLGQIPAMFNLEWLLRDYDRYDLSSLEFAMYGGNSVTRSFVERVAAMASTIGTGLGLTECAGFCTYVKADRTSVEQMILAGVGHDMPIYPCTIRQPMRHDGNAGDELPMGESGHVCFRGPQTFLGYVNDPEATAKTISYDGFLYTGDLGFKDAAGLHLTGREKWVIKSFGHQIYPGDVEAHICALADKVTNCVAVGVAHEVVAEAVVALVEKKPGVEVSIEELDRHARSLPPYMRPRHWIILEPGTMPLNRAAKPDYLRAQEMARREISQLRARGNWDSNYINRAQDDVVKAQD